jgi:DMSO/TMAO reductase YedYZ molybdopterin-dependent catalytic subunit
VPRLIARRKFLLGLGASALIAGCQSAPAQVFLSGMTTWNQFVQQLLFSRRRLAPEEPASALTPASEFPAYFVSPMMPYPPNNWSLKVGGMVDRPMVLSLADLKRLPRTDMRVRHHCVEGWSAVASWHGVQLREIARMAGAHRDARYVEFRSFDAGYWSSWDRESALHPQSLLAYGMNGHDLYPDHGAPLRIYSPVKLGYKSVKYVTEVNFLPTRTGGYWENQGYEWYAGV